MTAIPEPHQIDHYRMLGVEPSADSAAIERAYRAWRSARTGPLDRAGQEANAIEQAYRELSDPGSRQAYDQRRRQWLLEKVRSLHDGAAGPWGPAESSPVLQAGLALATDERLGRVLAVTAHGRVEWTFTGLDAPGAATWAGSGQALVCETGRNRVLLLEVGPDGPRLARTVEGLRHQGEESLAVRGPRDALRLPSGHLLIADTLNHRVIELDEQDEIKWQYGNPGDDPDHPGGAGEGELCSPVAVSRLENGNVLITDAGNGRLLEVSPDGTLDWSWPAHEAGASAVRKTTAGRAEPSASTTGDEPVHWINHSQRLAAGGTLVATDCLREIGPAGEVNWTYAPVATDIGRAYPLASGQLLLDVTQVQARGLSKVLLAVDRSGKVTWHYEYSKLKAASRKR